MSQTIAKKTPRDSNIELLRIVLMLMIIGYHFITHGANFSSFTGDYTIESNSSVAYIFLKSILVLSVNCFVFISGFYGIRFKIETALGLLLQASAYALIITLAIDGLGLQNMGLRKYLEALFPVFAGTWWFITAYFALYLISPLLNGAVGSFSQKQLLFVVVSLTFINSIFGFVFNAKPLAANYGYSLISFIHIYLLAQYCKKYVSLSQLQRWALPGFLLCSLLIFTLALFSITGLEQKGILQVFAYNNPLVLASAICFFFIFHQIRFQQRLINSISPYVLGVYLFHDHPFTRQYLIEALYEWSLSSNAALHFACLLALSGLVFLVGVVLDVVRATLLNPLVRYLIRRFGLLRLEGIFQIKASRS